MRAVILGLAALLAIGCGARTRLVKNENAVIVEGLFEVWGTWLKEKGSKVDLRLQVANEFGEPILIRTHDIHCSKGERWGNVRFIDEHARAQAVHVHPGRVSTVTLVCELADPTPGPFRVLLGRVFEDPHGSSSGVGELLASDIEWMVPEELIE